jgi:IMP dehydrogenase
MPEILPEALCFDDIFLVPRHSDISSRDEVDLSVSLPKGVALGLPIISAPMTWSL